MNITLKSLKVFEEMSEETTAFVADVFVNNKKVAYAKNDGRGGCTYYHPYEGMRELLREAEAYCQSLPDVVTEYLDRDGNQFTIPQSLELTIDELVSKKEEEVFIKKRDKACVKSFVYGTKNQYSMRGWKKIKNLNEIPLVHLQMAYNKLKVEIDGTDKEIFNSEEQLKELGIIL